MFEEKRMNLQRANLRKEDLKERYWESRNLNFTKADEVMNGENYILTLDIDWAPDFIIDQIAQILIEKKVKATWFVTHSSPAINHLRKHPDLFELGLHPNFYPDSTHGKTEDEVMMHIRRIVPEAISMRTHGLYQNSNLLLKVTSKYGVKIDVSLFLPYAPYLQPHILNFGGMNLFRIPYFWEDDLEMFNEIPCWDLNNPKFHSKGFKIFNFHPIHIALNSNNYKTYTFFKAKHSFSELTPQKVESFMNKDYGTTTLFLSLVQYLSNNGGGGRLIRELYK